MHNAALPNGFVHTREVACGSGLSLVAMKLGNDYTYESLTFSQDLDLQLEHGLSR